MIDPNIKPEFIECERDPVYFFNTYFRLKSEGQYSKGVFLNSLGEELVETMAGDSARIIARYPRKFGKTTLLIGYALHQILFKNKKIVYMSSNYSTRIMFLRDLRLCFSLLAPFGPRIIHEAPNDIEFSNGGFISLGDWDADMSINKIGYHYDIFLCDEPSLTKDLRGRNKLEDLINYAHPKIIAVGTFTSQEPIVGKVWSTAREQNNGWISLPSINQEWKLETLISITDPKYTTGYLIDPSCRI